MSDDYAQLAPIYHALGMAQFAESVTPTLINFALGHDWVGRRAVDLGCGTGASVRWLANHGYNITGIDNSPAMLEIARESITGSGLGFQLLEGDIRALADLHDIDLVLAIDVLNELSNLRDLEAVFAGVAGVLAPEKLFVFDLHTIEGLARRAQESGVISKNDDLVVMLTNQFDYDRQTSSAEYLIFQRAGLFWQRQQALRTMRGFPVQVVSALLQRAGFGIMALLNTQFQPIDIAGMHEPRVIYFAQRTRSETD